MNSETKDIDMPGGLDVLIFVFFTGALLLIALERGGMRLVSFLAALFGSLIIASHIPIKFLPADPYVRTVALLAVVLAFPIIFVSVASRGGRERWWPSLVFPPVAAGLLLSGIVPLIPTALFITPSAIGKWLFFDEFSLPLWAFAGLIALFIAFRTRSI